MRGVLYIDSLLAEIYEEITLWRSRGLIYNEKMEIPIDKLGLYNKLIKQHPEIERKGKTTPYTSINGHMFSFLDKEGKMGLRLSKGDIEEFIEKFQTKLMIQHGRTMKEYIEIPDDLLSDTSLLSIYFQRSLDYVSGLKPKPSKRKN